MNLGRISASMCVGGIFDLSLGSDVSGGGGNPVWVVGDTFLVSSTLPSTVLRCADGIMHRTRCLISSCSQKNVYSVFRSNPAAVGFAQLSDAAGGSSGACPFPFRARRKHEFDKLRPLLLLQSLGLLPALLYYLRPLLHLLYLYPLSRTPLSTPFCLLTLVIRLVQAPLPISPDLLPSPRVSTRSRPSPAQVRLVLLSTRSRIAHDVYV